MTDSVITARGLTKRFGEVIAVDGIDFEIAPGESFGFLGPNGAGKSTTMRMIAATSTRTGGELSVLGLDANEYPARRDVEGFDPADLESGHRLVLTAGVDWDRSR